MFKSTTHLQRRAVRPPDRRRRRRQQRLDRRRRHRVPRGRAVEPPRDAAVGRGRADDRTSRSTRRTSSRSARSSRRNTASASSPRRTAASSTRSSPASYLEHPYKRPGIGSIEDLEAATLADVVAFHARHYRPDNATLIVAGDFDPKQLDAWIDKYFGRCRSRPTPLPRVEAREPAWHERPHRQGHRPAGAAAGGRADLAGAAGRPAPTRRRCRSPAPCSRSGESSRLNQSLVYRQRIATQAGFSADLRVGPGLLIAYAIAAGGKSPADARRGAARRGDAPRERRRRLRPSSPRSRRSSSRRRSCRARRRSASPRRSADAAVLEGDRGARQHRPRRPAARHRRRRAARLRKYVLGAHKVTIDYRQEEVAKK